MIDQAIAENRFGERICYSLAILFALAGVAVLGCGIWLGQGLLALAASIPGALLWPALREARRIREKNLAIRLLEVPLSKPHTADEAAKLVSEMFKTLFSDDK